MPDEDQEVRLPVEKHVVAARAASVIFQKVIAAFPVADAGEPKVGDKRNPRGTVDDSPKAQTVVTLAKKPGSLGPAACLYPTSRTR